MTHPTPPPVFHPSPPSRMSMLATLLNTNQTGGQRIGRGSATCFVVERHQRQYLVTNWHVVTGRNADTGEPLGRFAAGPQILSALTPVSQFQPRWRQEEHELYDLQGRARWLVHPAHREGRVDLAALPLDGDRREGYNLDEPRPLAFGPAADVSIIGFPYGDITGGGYAVWSRGAVASEPKWDYGGDPVFLVDSRTRDSQSGSPVIAFRAHPVMDPSHERDWIESDWDFLGVYSGRTSLESDLGRVWKRGTLIELLDAGQVDTETYP